MKHTPEEVVALSLMGRTCKDCVFLWTDKSKICPRHEEMLKKNRWKVNDSICSSFEHLSTWKDPGKE